MKQNINKLIEKSILNKTEFKFLNRQKYSLYLENMNEEDINFVLDGYHDYLLYFENKTLAKFSIMSDYISVIRPRFDGFKNY